MTKVQCKIRLLDDVTAVLVGLHPDHLEYFYNQYAVPAKNFFFNPKFKLGQWDGKIRYFHKTGKTFVYLLPEILPQLAKFGYSLVVDDLRFPAPSPELIDGNVFGHIVHMDTGKPIELRDYQYQGVNQLIEHGNGLIIAATSAGKAQPLDSKILTPTGWRKMGELQVGDAVMTPYGYSTDVLGVYPQGKKQTFRITFHDGATALCCDEHLWTVSMPIRPSTAKTHERVVTTSQIRQFLDHKSSSARIPGNITIQTIRPFEYDNPTHCDIPPYLLGALIGDGCLSAKNTLMFSSNDDQIIDRLSQLIQPYDLSLKKKRGVDYGITQNTRHAFPPVSNPLVELLAVHGLMGTKSETKFIPNPYKRAALSDRLLLLQGLFDTDGTVDKRGNVSYTTVSPILAKDIQEMLWAIGAVCTITTRTPTYTYKGSKRCGKLAYTLHVSIEDRAQLFALTRKRDRCIPFGAGKRIHGRRVLSVIPHDAQEVQCIMVSDSNQLYVTDDFIVTHNTLLCAALVDAYGKVGVKTLTIVPNQDLITNTKKDYIHCGLDTGEYSGTLKALDHQHIVSTWQALKNNPKIIEQFGLVLVDECHGAQGNVLQKILTDHASKIPFRFGVTGTLPKDPAGALSVKVALGPVRASVQAHELQERGVLAQLHIDILQLQENLQPQYNEFLTQEVPIGKPPTYTQFKDSYFPDYASEKSHIHRKSERIEWIADFLIAKSDNKKGNVLCLVDSITLGRQLAALIPNAIFVNGKDMKKSVDRQRVYDMFKTNDNLIVIATVHIAGTGLNIHRIFNLVFIDIGKSFIRVIQGIGRGLRMASDKDAVTVTDICSDLKYGKRHVKERMNFYDEAQYKYKKHKLDYTKQELLGEFE